MALEMQYAKQEDIPEGLKDHYIKTGDVYVVDIPGMPSKKELSRISTLLTEEKTAHESAKSKMGILGGADLDRLTSIMSLSDEFGDDFSASVYKNTISKLKTLESTRNLDTAALDEKILEQTRRANALLTENKVIKKKYEEADASREVYQNQISNQRIVSEVRASAKAAGVKDDALIEIDMHATRLFEIDPSNRVVAKDGLTEQSGMPPILTGATPEDWVLACKAHRKIWWPDSVSLGSLGGEGGLPSGVNPWDPKTQNLTQQTAAFKENPETARAMAKVHGVNL